MYEWAGEEVALFRTNEWWASHIARSCEDLVEVKVCESSVYEQVWQEWTASGHEYGIRDGEFLERGLKDILNIAMIVVKKKD